MSKFSKNFLTRNPHFTAAGPRSAQSPGQQKVEPHRRAALDWRADFWQHARLARCGGVWPCARPSSNPRPPRLLPYSCSHRASGGGCGLHPILLFEPRDPALSFEPRQSTSEPTGQRIRRLTGPRRQSLRRQASNPVILPHLCARAGASPTGPGLEPRRPAADAHLPLPSMPPPSPLCPLPPTALQPPPPPPPTLTAAARAHKITRRPVRRFSQAAAVDRGSNPPASSQAVRTRPRIARGTLSSAWAPHGAHASAATPGPLGARGKRGGAGGGRRGKAAC